MGFAFLAPATVRAQAETAAENPGTAIVYAAPGDSSRRESRRALELVGAELQSRGWRLGDAAIDPGCDPRAECMRTFLNDNDAHMAVAVAVWGRGDGRDRGEVAVVAVDPAGHDVTASGLFRDGEFDRAARQAAEMALFRWPRRAGVPFVVRTAPPGMPVQLDGGFIGNSPVEDTLAIGAHELRVIGQRGYRGVRQYIEVDGDTAEVVLDLPLERGEVSREDQELLAAAIAAGTLSEDHEVVRPERGSHAGQAPRDSAELPGEPAATSGDGIDAHARATDDGANDGADGSGEDQLPQLPRNEPLPYGYHVGAGAAILAVGVGLVVAVAVEGARVGECVEDGCPARIDDAGHAYIETHQFGSDDIVLAAVGGAALVAGAALLGVGIHRASSASSDDDERTSFRLAPYLGVAPGRVSAGVHGVLSF